MNFGNEPFPESDRLGVRIVDTEDANALFDPEANHVTEFFPEVFPVIAVKVERVDVLVLLGRVLGVLDGTVRAAVKPLGMLGDVGMIDLEALYELSDEEMMEDA